jgi:hypothetical protein
MSETGPIASIALVRSTDLGGDSEREVEIRTSAGMAAPLVEKVITTIHRVRKSYGPADICTRATSGS